MAEAGSLFWSFGSLYFGYLADISIFGVSVLCYILGAWLVSQVITTLLRTGRSIKIRNTHYTHSYHHYYHGEGD